MFNLNLILLTSAMLATLPYSAMADDVDASTPTVDPNTCVVEIEPVDKQYVQQQVMPIPDQEANHDIRLGETTQSMKDTELCTGDHIVKKNAYFMQDAHGLNGEGTGYNVFITDKGDQIIFKTSSIAKFKDGEEPMSVKETNGYMISGTGPYENVTGTYKSTSEDNRFKNTTRTIKQTLTLKFPPETKAKLQVNN